MKKILIFHPYLTPYRIDLYNRLAHLFNIYVILTSSYEERKTLGFDLDFINKQAQFKFIYVNKGFYFGRHLISSFFFNQIQLFKPDIIIAHELGVNTIISIFCKMFIRYKLFITIDDSPKMIQSYNKIRTILQHFVVRNSDAFLVVHPDVKDFLDNKYKSKYYCQFVYFPIIQDEESLKKKYHISLPECKAISLKYNLRDKKIILFVGRLESVKSPDKLLRAFHYLNSKDTILVFVGKGSLDFYLKEYVRKNQLEENVLFTGQLSGSSLYAWYQLADVFVLPSCFEPFGAVINEALVAGCFVVTTDQVGANSLIDSSNGVVFRLEDEKKFSEILMNSLKKIPNQKKSMMPITFNEIITSLEKII